MKSAAASTGKESTSLPLVGSFDEHRLPRVHTNALPNGCLPAAYWNCKHRMTVNLASASWHFFVWGRDRYSSAYKHPHEL